MSAALEQKLKNTQAALDSAPPDWVVTFGDLMSLLLCFFVLLLSFSETDKAIYKEVAGSLSKAFGIQRKIKTFDSPKGEKIIAKNFDMQHLATKDKKELGKEIKREKDKFAEKINKEIETHFKGIKDKIEVEVGKENVTIRMMGETAFASGKAEILPAMRPLIEKTGAALKGGKGEIIVCGHTDNLPVRGGKYESNLRLSIARAAMVGEFLIKRIGIQPSRIVTMGFGQYRPLVSNNTPAGRSKNRRVEITLTTSAFPSVEKNTPAATPSQTKQTLKQKTFKIGNAPVYKIKNKPMLREP
jgi:chemotaxis protein MotB